jgi:hypothetical protein
MIALTTNAAGMIEFRISCPTLSLENPKLALLILWETANSQNLRFSLVRVSV